MLPPMPEPKPKKHKITALRLQERWYVVGQRPHTGYTTRLSVLSIEEFDVGGQMGYVKWYRVNFLAKEDGYHTVNGAHVHVIEYSDTLDA